MADTNIQSITKDLLSMRIVKADTSMQVKGSASDSFSKHLDRTSKQSFKTEDKTSDKMTETQSDMKTDTDKKSYINDELRKNQSISRKQKGLEEKAAIDETAVSADMSLTAANVTEELKEAVAEELDMSVEELESLMNSMNFTDMDLFDTEKLGMIVLEANGLTQTQDLLFDKAAADDFKSIMALLDNANAELLQSGIQVSEEGFLDMATGESIQMSNVNTDEFTDEFTDSMADMSTETEQKITENTYDAGMTDEKMKNASDENTSNVPEENALTDKNSQNAANPQKSGNDGQESNSDGKNHRERNVKSDGSVLNETNVRFNPIEEIQVELTERVGRSQAENIISQLMERIRFSVNDEFKGMEMQLYPEHLGKVGVHVAIRDGILTAHITAENETVKNAIEAQLANLKESFNNQGLKVENVEVTIASHSFEENNMQNNGEQSNQGRGKRSRKVNSSLLDELSGITEEQSEETVMEALGNTVSYTA